MIKKSFFRAGLLVVLLPFGQVQAQDGQCMDHYSKQGNILKGRAFKSWAEYPGVSVDVAFRKLQQEVVKQGFTVISADRKAGTISADQGVIGSGRRVPLNILVSRNGGGVRVELSLTPAGGLFVDRKGLKKGFCDILEAPVK